MSEILRWQKRKTRKPHKCFGCHKTYPSGTEMVYSAYADGGTVQDCYWCETCQEYMRRNFEYGDETGPGEIFANDPEGWNALKAELEAKDKMMNELEPCPHCGKPAEPVHIEPLHNSAYIICTDHNCLGHMQIQWGIKDNEEEFIQILKDNWNRRAVPENKPLTLEQLRQMDGVPIYCTGEIGLPMTNCEWKVLEWIDTKIAYFTDGARLRISEFGKTWIAYDRKLGNNDCK